ncbi:PREDICTED: EF-hand calcium-binding domain-containing protein 5 [Eurypyga helias]|uniref:EF-hand calcium-binding domain-containing protein 5 n=1 Tax=Eurypyga helias TaxID=54383 RepID=UPI0005291C9A|nr:PREDICTED: EF-hand calcium-binding domain-containing protein 5 [Eurypyga helias]
MKRSERNDERPCLSNSAPWKKCFYEKVQQRCLSLQETKVETIRAQKAKEEKVKEREPCDWLSKEWLSEEKESLDTRIYLLDKLLPTLIPGMEKLLMEVERKNLLAPEKEPTTFNPIHFLGEYLMRHNPRYGPSTKPDPYLIGMKMVTEELKTRVPGTTSERLARMKLEAKNKRKDREQVDNMMSQVKEKRKEALAIVFREWTVDVSGRIPVALVQSALRSFPDVTAPTPIDVSKAIQDRKLEIVDTLGRKVNMDEFTEYVHSCTEYFSNDTFQEILKHLCQCAEDFRDATRCDTWRQMFTDLFLDCDYGKVGLLDRQKILALLADFYDRSPVTAKRGLCHPGQWPIIELQEIELADLWGGPDGQEVCEELSGKLVLSPAGISKGEISAHEPVDGNGQVTSRMRSKVSKGLSEQIGLSEAEAGGISTGENQAAESSAAEGRKEGEDAVSAEKSTDFGGCDLDGDAMRREKSSFHEDIKTERRSESASAGRREEAFLGSASTRYSLSGDGEPGSEKQVEKKEFSLGGEPDTETNREEDGCVSDRDPGSKAPVSQENWITEMTSTVSAPPPEATAITSEDRAVADVDAIDSEQDAPVAEVVKEIPARKGSFSRQHGSQFGQEISSERRPQDEDLLQDQGKDLRPIVAEIQKRRASPPRSAFDERCLNLPQFVQLMETFVGEDISLPTVERLTAFIKEEYEQTEEEKMEQLEKVRHMSRLARRKLLLEALFERWDNNASGFLALEEVDAVLSTFKEGMEKEAVRKGKDTALL